jgi:hypothetical protein
MVTTQSLSAFTVIFKSGKKMEGTLLWDDGETLRFKDRNGILYSLKRSVLDIPAMKEANPQSVDESGESKISEAEREKSSSMPSSLAEIAERERLRRTGNAPLLSDQDLENTAPLAVIETRNAAPLITNIHTVSIPDSAKELKKWITENELEFNKLKAACRNAGGDPNSEKEFRTDTYSVNGKDVTVSGYWADPEEVKRAQDTCRRAMAVKSALEEARTKLSSKTE